MAVMAITLVWATSAAETDGALPSFSLTALVHRGAGHQLQHGLHVGRW